ncbi:MAG: ribosome-associated translation inhibitor RaiA [Chloroflexota bacterium]
MTIPVNVYAKNMEVTERIRKYVTGKVSKLPRYLNGIHEARVDLSYIKSARNAEDRQVAQITVKGRGFVLRAEECNADIFTAFDTAMNKLERRIERYKGKLYAGRGDGQTIGELFAEQELAALESEEEQTLIARRKRFRLIPMDVAEAIQQMELLGHQNFFVFFNAQTSEVNVLYKRRDGLYGLIETELG